jgi:hypothetical protein
MRTDIRAFRLDRYYIPEAAPRTEKPFGKALLAEGVELAGSVTSDGGVSTTRSRT